MMNPINNIVAALAATATGKSDGGLVKATVVRGPSGEGVFTLRLSGGREMGVQIQADGGGVALEPGQKVLVSPSDGKIFIPVDAAAEQPAQSQQWALSQQPTQMRQAADMLLRQIHGGDEFVSGRLSADGVSDGGDGAETGGAQGASAEDQANLAKIVGFKVVSEGEAHPDGIYKADAAGHILEGQAESGAPMKDVAAVRLSTVNGQQVVTALSGDGLQAALEELRGSFESPLLRALPLDLLKDIFNERGFLDTDTLKALDAALVNRSLSIDASSQLQMERIGQWLRIALDNPEMAGVLVDRIPVLGAKDAAGLLELIGRLSSGVAPESFFATESTLPPAPASTGGADLLQRLLKSAFSAAPDALINLVKRIDASSVVLGAQLPPAEAARVAKEITSALPARAADSLHDAGQLSPRVLENSASAAPKMRTPASAVPQIRAGYSELTESAVRALLGGGDGKASATAVGEKINALREAVARIPVTSVTSSGQGHDDVERGNRDVAVRVNGNRIGTINTSSINTDNNIAAANKQSAATGRLSVSVPASGVSVNAQIAAHRASASPGDVNTNLGGGAVKAADASFPAVNRGFVSQPQAYGAANRVDGGGINNSGINVSNINTVSINTGDVNTGSLKTDGVNSANNPNIRGGGIDTTGINTRGFNASNINVNGINTNPVNSTNNQSTHGIGINTNGNISQTNNVGGLGINTSGINAGGISASGVNASITNANGVNTNAVNSMNNQNASGVGINTNVNVRPTDNIGVMGINTNVIDSTNNQNTSGVGISANVNVRPTDNTGVMGIDSTDNQNIRSVGINANPSANSNTGPTDNVDGMGVNTSRINTNGINSVDNQTVRGVGINTNENIRPADDVGGIGVNTGSIDSGGINSVDNQNIRAVGTGTNEHIRFANGPGGMGINTNSIDVSVIKADCLSIVDALTSSVAPILRNLAQRGDVGVGAGASLIGLVRDAVSSLDEALRPLVRSERPVPPEFYDRVAAGAGHRISVEARNALFSQIGSAQALVGGALEAAERARVGTGTGTNANVGVNNNSSNNNTNSANTDSGVGTNANAAINSNVSASVSTVINSNVGTKAGAVISPNVGTNANVNPVPNSGGRSDDFLLAARRIWANTEKLRAGFREAFSTLDLQNRASPLDESAAGSTTAGTVRRSADTLRTEILLDVSRALSDVFSSVDELREIVSQLSNGQKALPDAEAALLRAVRALEHQSRQSGVEVMERLKDVLRELNRLQAAAARAQEQGGAAATRSSPAEAIRSAALTAARSLENLQLLTTQTRVAETEQHLLALPAKIGGEWTEVQIKFVKERKGEKGENKDGHVSIYLNVAPSALGQVTAHLDYLPPNLKLAFQFEKPEVTRWFRQRSAELREALSQAGLPGTVLEFYSRRPVKSEPIDATRLPSGIDDGGIDRADGFEIKNGRVDFKI